QPIVARPLEAPQISPIGDVRTENEVRVTFPEPMVAVAAVGDAKAPVATISPSVAGTWRGIGTRTATFTTAAEPAPQATAFTVPVAAGARAETGAVLPAAATASFKTGAPELDNVYPALSLRADAPIAVRFDQDVDPGAIAKFLRVEIDRKPVAWKAIG